MELTKNEIGGSTMYGAQSMIQQAACPAPSDLKIVPLPFFDVHNVLLPPMELSAAPAPNQRYTSKLAYTFNIDPKMCRNMTYNYNNQGLPRYEVQLRFFNCTELKEPQTDDFPPNIIVKVNGMIIQLPDLIPTNKPNDEAKRPSRPVCLTQQCQRRAGSQQLSIEWMCDERSWAVAVYYVYRVNAEILYERMVENQSKHHEIEVTKREIIKKLGGNDDDGIAMDQLRVRLLCPLVKVRMTCPARCSDCTHLQCFDLRSYLMTNEKRPVWNCPVCSGYAPYDKLIIDEYFKDVLGKVDSSTTEVELKLEVEMKPLKIDKVESKFTISSLLEHSLSKTRLFDEESEVKTVATPSTPSTSNFEVKNPDVSGKKHWIVIDTRCMTVDVLDSDEFKSCLLKFEELAAERSKYLVKTNLGKRKFGEKKLLYSFRANESFDTILVNSIHKFGARNGFVWTSDEKVIESCQESFVFVSENTTSFSIDNVLPRCTEFLAHVLSKRKALTEASVNVPKPDMSFDWSKVNFEMLEEQNQSRRKQLRLARPDNFLESLKRKYIESKSNPPSPTKRVEIVAEYDVPSTSSSINEPSTSNGRKSPSSSSPFIDVERLD